ncbi:IS3 family transposase [Pseudonocardia alni]|uniref:IS3 family transposase n=1 Tax=Pseudonocardia alni TaxID=33907 RepID=UPI00280ABD38|nr:IS3 family transposase [Pseudonocardia alni]
MRPLGLRGARRGRPLLTTPAERHTERAPDLVERDFHAKRPNALWVVDLIYVPTWSGTGFTAFVSDIYSRRIVDRRCATTMPTEPPLDALEMALWTRDRAGQTTDGRLDGLIHHSDAGSQCCAIYRNRLAEAGAPASLGSVGDSYDNAPAESVIGLYRTECVRRDRPIRSVEDLEPATASWVHGFNTHRLHSMIGNVPPVGYELNYYARQPLPRRSRRGRTEPPLNPGRFTVPMSAS